MDDDSARTVPLSATPGDGPAAAGVGAGLAVGIVPFVVLIRKSGEWGWWAAAAGALLLVAVVAGFTALSAGRAAARLEGSVLVLRRFRERRCDLATADVVLDRDRVSWHSARTVPRLAARDPATGVTLRLELRTRNDAPLPSAELHALADAVGTGRTADRLGALADDPLAPDR